MLIRPTVAQVTALDPAAAAITPQPTTLTWSSPHGSRASHGASPLNMSDDSRVRNRISHNHTNSGSADDAQFQPATHTLMASSQDREDDGAGKGDARRWRLGGSR